MDLFTATNEKYTIDIPDGKFEVYPHFYLENEANTLFDTLMQDILWKQEKITIHGKTVDIPRLSAWYADAGKGYEYSGIYSESTPWNETLAKIRLEIESTTGEYFNSVLANLYRDGNDSVAWHSDNEKSLGDNPIIASLSLGESRDFQIRHKENRDVKKSFSLPHGSLLLMGKDTQLNWEHQLPKRKRIIKPRINLTYRLIMNQEFSGDYI